MMKLLLCFLFMFQAIANEARDDATCANLKADLQRINFKQMSLKTKNECHKNSGQCTYFDLMRQYDTAMAEYLMLKGILEIKSEIKGQLNELDSGRGKEFKDMKSEVQSSLDLSLIVNDILKNNPDFFKNHSESDILFDQEIKKYCKDHSATKSACKRLDKYIDNEKLHHDDNKKDPAVSDGYDRIRHALVDLKDHMRMTGDDPTKYEQIASYTQADVVESIEEKFRKTQILMRIKQGEELVDIFGDNGEKDKELQDLNLIVKDKYEGKDIDPLLVEMKKSIQTDLKQLKTEKADYNVAPNQFTELNSENNQILKDNFKKRVDFVFEKNSGYINHGIGLKKLMEQEVRLKDDLSIIHSTIEPLAKEHKLDFKCKEKDSNCIQEFINANDEKIKDIPELKRAKGNFEDNQRQLDIYKREEGEDDHTKALLREVKKINNGTLKLKSCNNIKTDIGFANKEEKNFEQVDNINKCLTKLSDELTNKMDNLEQAMKALKQQMEEFQKGNVDFKNIEIIKQFTVTQLMNDNGCYRSEENNADKFIHRQNCDREGDILNPVETVELQMENGLGEVVSRIQGDYLSTGRKEGLEQAKNACKSLNNNSGNNYNELIPTLCDQVEGAVYDRRIHDPEYIPPTPATKEQKRYARYAQNNSYEDTTSNAVFNGITQGAMYGMQSYASGLPWYNHQKLLVNLNYAQIANKKSIQSNTYLHSPQYPSIMTGYYSWLAGTPIYSAPSVGTAVTNQVRSPFAPTTTNNFNFPAMSPHLTGVNADVTPSNGFLFN